MYFILRVRNHQKYNSLEKLLSHPRKSLCYSMYPLLFCICSVLTLTVTGTAGSQLLSAHTFKRWRMACPELKSIKATCKQAT